MGSESKIKSIRLFIKPRCGWCVQAVKWLDERQIKYETLNVTDDAEAAREMWKLSGQGLAPTIDVDGKILADFDVKQLAEFLQQFE